MKDVIKKVEHTFLVEGGNLNLADELPVNRIWFDEIDFASPLEENMEDKYVFMRSSVHVATLKDKGLSEDDKQKLEREREYLRKGTVRDRA